MDRAIQTGKTRAASWRTSSSASGTSRRSSAVRTPPPDLHGMPTDQINRLRNQATQLGAAELALRTSPTRRSTEMTGATSPAAAPGVCRAPAPPPSADDTTRGITSRVDRLERRLSIPRGAGSGRAARRCPLHRERWSRATRPQLNHPASRPTRGPDASSSPDLPRPPPRALGPRRPAVRQDGSGTGPLRHDHTGHRRALGSPGRGGRIRRAASTPPPANRSRGRPRSPGS
ncbi:hypothetical protein QJS66_17035 [Kocuria rhizophila]|nr:hypothetical protein QJS66_17035 [Kocuria rhizophila]